MRPTWTPILSTTLNVVLAGAVALLIGTGDWNKKPSPSQMESLEIVDSEGRPRIVLAVDGETPTLRMLDQNEKVRIELRVRPFWDLSNDRDARAPYSVPSVRLLHANGEQGLELDLANGDLPWLEMHDDQRNNVVSLGLNSYDAPSLEMSDVAYQRHIGIRFDEKGYYGFAAYDPEFADLLRGGVTVQGSPALQLYGDDERQLASLEINTRRPRLGFWDLDGVLVHDVSPEPTSTTK